LGFREVAPPTKATSHPSDGLRRCNSFHLSHQFGRNRKNPCAALDIKLV
jgi:hypothetical protein